MHITVTGQFFLRKSFLIVHQPQSFSHWQRGDHKTKQGTMPNPRRSSTSKVASASSRQSFPATINSSTKVTKDKLDTIMTRRKRQSKRRAADLDKENSSMNGAHQDKENSAMNILQSPTPYWKVAKERGNTTPPETRSTKKRKCTSKRLDFSPSNENTAQ